MSEYYVYAYLRENTSETAAIGEPYYIGKGKDRRAYRSHRKHGIHLPKNTDNIVVLWEGLTEEFAMEMEMLLIATYGRADNDTGILRNKTDGGDGASGWIPTEENKRNIAKATKEAQSSTEYREARRAFQNERIKNGTHKLVRREDGSSIGGETARRLIEDGEHHFLDKNPNDVRCSCLVCHKETNVPGLGKHKKCHGETPAKLALNLAGINVRVSCIVCHHETNYPSLSRHIKSKHELVQTCLTHLTQRDTMIT